MTDFPRDFYAQLSSFDPPRELLAPPDWDEASQLLVRHGLGSIAAYNLQFRLPRVPVPDGLRETLLSLQHAISGDNVFKLVALKQVLAGVPGLRVVLLGAASYAESVYPHVAFRPVGDLQLLVSEAELGPLEQALRAERFLPAELDEPDPDEPQLVLYNQRYHVRLYTRLLPAAGEDAGLLARAVPARAFGASAFRLSAEDALLVQVLSLARRGFAVPLIEFVDLRELVAGSSLVLPGRGGPGAPIEAGLLATRARAFGVERALFAAMTLLGHLHPSIAERAAALCPELSLAARTLLETAVIAPARNPLRERQLRGSAALAQALFG